MLMLFDTPCRHAIYYVYFIYDMRHATCHYCFTPLAAAAFAAITLPSPAFVIRHAIDIAADADADTPYAYEFSLPAYFS